MAAGFGLMSFSFEPQLIKRDSAVPLRCIVFGWIAAVVVIVAIGPVANKVIAIMGLSLIAGGLVGLCLKAERTYRMVLGASTGAFITWLGFRFALADRLLPATSEPLELADRDRIGAIVLGLSVLAIGVGGVLEAIRAQRDPGSSPVPVKVFLIAIGLFITAAVSTTAGLSPTLSLVLAVAVAIGLSAMAFLRRERPLSDFAPQA